MTKRQKHGTNPRLLSTLQDILPQLDENLIRVSTNAKSTTTDNIIEVLAQRSLGIAASGLTKAAVGAKVVERSIARASRWTATTLHERVQGSQCLLRRFVNWHSAYHGNEGCETKERCLHFWAGLVLVENEWGICTVDVWYRELYFVWCWHMNWKLNWKWLSGSFMYFSSLIGLEDSGARILHLFWAFGGVLNSLLHLDVKQATEWGRRGKSGRTVPFGTSTCEWSLVCAVKRGYIYSL